VEKGQRIVVGVNKFAEGFEDSRIQGFEAKLLKVDPELGKRRAAELERFRRARDGEQVKHALVRVGETAATTKNLMEPIVAAVRFGCTVGEISDALRSVFGEYDRMR